MSFHVTPRYSVCTPTDPPKELHATNHCPDAFEFAATVPGSVVYDWKLDRQVTSCES